jgi:23S rRNA (guanosine2251-2'-O)-methyltransferase
MSRRPSRRDDRRVSGGEREAVLGGRRAAAEAIRAGLARRLMVVRGSRETQGLRAVLAEADREGIPIRWVAREAIDTLGLGDHQGVAVFVHPPPVMGERSLGSMTFGPDALAVVLDGITDPQNLGACARSAEAAGAAVLVLRERRSAPITPAAVRASAGALLHLPVARVPNLVRGLERLKDRGFFVAGLDAGGEDMRQATPPPGPLALVVGSEGEGLSRLVRESCDALVAIPLAGRTASLNASAALAAGLFGYALRA